MVTLSTSGVVGTDNAVPVYDPTAPWKTWLLPEVYVGREAKGKYVPKINDYVKDPDTNQDYRVIDIDPVTMIPTWIKVKNLNTTETLSDEDILLGVGPGRANETMRAYLDTRRMPHDLAIEQRLKVHGSSAAYARIFRGTELDSSQHVISMFFDASGNFLGQDIPLELAKETGNRTTKSVMPCKTTEAMEDGELVTVVIYNQNNVVLSKNPLLVENTAFISQPNEGTKFIKEFHMESPFMSSSDANLLLYPLNVLQAGLSLMGVVTYTDGSSLKLPVDGTKFELLGFENYATQREGVEIPLVLRYNLGDEEVAYGESVNPDRFVTKKYRARTEAVDGAYSIKLFCYPVWLDAQNGYRLEWFMADLERTMIWNVTAYVRYNENAPTFKPLQYGTTQRLSVGVNLKDVNGAFVNHIHNETMDVALLKPGTDRMTNWTVLFDPGQATPYGVATRAETTLVNANLTRVDLRSGCTTLEQWLERFYYNTMPLKDGTKEQRAPEPNFFAIEIGNNRVELPISAWSTINNVSFSLPNNGTLFLRFFKRTPDNDIQLSVAGVPIYQQ